MGLLDHRKTWQFTLKATPDQCLRGFSSVFDGTRKGGPLIARAKWKVGRTPTSASAIYQGRGGVIGAATILTSRGSDEQAGAVGSVVMFETEAGENGRTVCRMWLDLSASTWGFTNDARFLRPYMQRVQHSLAEVDPHVVVQTT